MATQDRFGLDRLEQVGRIAPEDAAGSHLEHELRTSTSRGSVRESDEGRPCSRGEAGEAQPGHVLRIAASLRTEEVEDDEREAFGSHHAFACAQGLVLVSRPDPEQAVQGPRLIAAGADRLERRVGVEGVGQVDPGREDAVRECFGDEGDGRRQSGQRSDRC